MTQPQKPPQNQPKNRIRIDALTIPTLDPEPVPAVEVHHPAHASPNFIDAARPHAATEHEHVVSPHIAEEIFDAIDLSTNIMLVMHQKPDGDTAGSVLGMAHYLDSIHKPHTVFCVDPLPSSLQFLPGAEKITTETSHWASDLAQFDLIIVFDGGDLGYVGVEKYIKELRRAKKEFRLINIDHHATNTFYGDINLVIATASSTCEIVHDLLEWKDGLTKKGSECLLTGLLTDTGHFMNLATTASAVDAASALMNEGVNLWRLSNHTMRNLPLTTLRLWGRALERLNRTKHGLIYTVITQQDIEECHASHEAVSGISNFLNSLNQEEGDRAILVLVERENGTVKGSMRTTHRDSDVSKLALFFGGGGHKKAAGFEIQGRLIQEPSGHWVIE